MRYGARQASSRRLKHTDPLLAAPARGTMMAAQPPSLLHLAHRITCLPGEPQTRWTARKPDSQSTCLRKRVCLPSSVPVPTPVPTKPLVDGPACQRTCLPRCNRLPASTWHPALSSRANLSTLPGPAITPSLPGYHAPTSPPRLHPSPTSLPTSRHAHAGNLSTGFASPARPPTCLALRCRRRRRLCQGACALRCRFS